MKNTKVITSSKYVQRREDWFLIDRWLEKRKLNTEIDKDIIEWVS